MKATEPTRAPADVAHASTGRIAGQAELSAVEVLLGLGSEMGGLSRVEAAARLVTVGPNAVRTHKAQAWVVLGRQLKSPILILLFVTAGLSLALGDAINSTVIGVILVFSVGLGFWNEFRAERAAKRGELTAEKRHVLTVAGDVAGIECFHDVLLSMCDRRRPNEAGAGGVGGGMA